MLEDGTRLWVSDTHLTELTPGEKVHATFETKGDKKLVTEFDRQTTGPDGETSNLGARSGAGN